MVDKLLTELHLEGKAKILVLNKIDLLLDQGQGEEYIQRLQAELSQERVVTVSAAMEWGLDNLLNAIVKLLAHKSGQTKDAIGFWANHR